MKKLTVKEILGEEKINRKKLNQVSDHLIQELLASANIVDILVNEYDLLLMPGSNGWYSSNCPMPNHRDSTPSFGVNPEEGRYNCFGCGQKGNILNFIRAVEGLSFFEAVIKLAEITNFELNLDDDANRGRIVRQIESLFDEQLKYRSGETDLPGAISEVEYLRSTAQRLKDFERKVNYDPEEIAIVDEIYSRIDDAMMNENHKELNKIWKEIGTTIREHLKRYKEEHKNDEIETSSC